MVLQRAIFSLLTMIGATQNFPLVSGHEITGIIERTGSGAKGLKNGDRVEIGYQQEACFKCQFCKEGNEQFALIRK